MGKVGLTFIYYDHGMRMEIIQETEYLVKLNGELVLLRDRIGTVLLRYLDILVESFIVVRLGVIDRSKHRSKVRLNNVGTNR